ncbi:hypothetical protein CEUSTIGMA_g3974.t1 [Chlamydomonas eustigma]|uniref:Uncharacterized protein n=1 Tax=Chlamydomonas eustigma TaxID=1157962 RepID=A0A250X0D6_9CHLO|nr:hypothetical protein CEUSTIGMA_g3974.t1 [Chlamydomonas eustigma]|eukprot:GAX76528.1 hypothetical protein CEUSTIGMA_g3974.t1 [Chlamydomonas eustigma]
MDTQRVNPVLSRRNTASDAWVFKKVLPGHDVTKQKCYYMAPIIRHNKSHANLLLRGATAEDSGRASWHVNIMDNSYLSPDEQIMIEDYRILVRELRTLNQLIRQLESAQSSSKGASLSGEITSSNCTAVFSLGTNEKTVGTHDLQEAQDCTISKYFIPGCQYESSNSSRDITGSLQKASELKRRLMIDAVRIRAVLGKSRDPDLKSQNTRKTRSLASNHPGASAHNINDGTSYQASAKAAALMSKARAYKEATVTSHRATSKQSFIPECSRGSSDIPSSSELSYPIYDDQSIHRTDDGSGASTDNSKTLTSQAHATSINARMRNALLAAGKYKVRKSGSFETGVKMAADVDESVGPSVQTLNNFPLEGRKGDNMMGTSAHAAGSMRLENSEEYESLTWKKLGAVNEEEKFIVEDGAGVILTAAVDVNALRKERLMDESLVPLICP